MLGPRLSQGVLARTKGVEVQHAIYTEHHCFAVDHELPVPVLERDSGRTICSRLG
jgi:hypothetical protein